MYEVLNTPCFIVMEKELEKNIKDMNLALKKYWNNYIIGYSYKTNSLLWIINYLKKNNCYAEVVSDLEYKLALKIGYTKDCIIFNGPNKGKNQFFDALKNGSIVNIDSFREISWLENTKFNYEIKVEIRVNFNLERECPSETIMGKELGRFGFSLENGDLKNVINKINSIKNVKVVGVHMHNSTKTRSLNIYKALSEKACEISKLFNYELEYVDIGGGFFGGLEGKPSYLDYMKIISKGLSKSFKKENTKLIVEPGASLIASPIKFLCEVVDVKRIGSSKVVVINGSRNNIDPLMRKNNYFYKFITKNNKRCTERQIISGYTCMENDRLMSVFNEKELTYGDKIIFDKVGAYTMSLSPLFIEYFPNVYLIDKFNKIKCIREAWDVNEYIQKSILE
ncbi:pyridoxal-dependent decarboxylase [Eubacterium multiforme]|uniref:Diaminopimelate decarboxylase n=1 Tax=Eubacterium multiforme TaxID=83339 RepID=A0ABT9UX49_9FIRM|nr:pyridoxal-dependent decarboxylase [Eubacterium multiforme]MDQ0150883.1 diaminopimelate decarboxylase [Eubacterium multiforme]